MGRHFIIFKDGTRLEADPLWTTKQDLNGTQIFETQTMNTLLQDSNVSRYEGSLTHINKDSVIIMVTYLGYKKYNNFSRLRKCRSKQ